MGMKLLCYLGFGRSTEQAQTPPFLAWILAFPIAFFGAQIVEGLTFFFEWLSVGYLTRWWISVGFRTIGFLGGLIWLHSVYRFIFHHDDNSWGGTIRKIILKPQA